MLGPIKSPPATEGFAARFRAEFEIGLIGAGLKLVDKKALKQALDEASIAQENASDFTELAGALGARLIITGSVTGLGETTRVQIKVIEVATGRIIVSSAAPLELAQEKALSPHLSLDGQLRRLSDNLAEGLAMLRGETRYSRFAVLPFDEAGETTKQKQLGLLVSSELTTLLVRDHGIMLVERTQLNRIIDELALGQSGLFDKEQSVEVGKIVGAEGLIIGTVSEVGDYYAVDARVVNVADAKVAHTTKVNLPAADLVALSSEAVVLRTRAGAVYRSLLLPGWGQTYNRQPIKGAVLVLSEVAAAGLAVGFHLRGNSLYDRYHKLDANASSEMFAKRLDDANSAYTIRNAFIWTLVAIHVVNVIDAFINGTTYGSALLAGE
ncbi:MAG: hypothetical protein JW841_03745 [Deltaproteobacteria bacterium]|nr:hypothetical protein [Deltaproteobacteria bacterium]